MQSTELAPENYPATTYLCFLQSVFEQCKHTGIDIAALHHVDELQLAIASDVGIAIGEDPRRRFIPAIYQLSDSSDFIVCQALYNEVERGYHIIIDHPDHPASYLHIDCIYDPSGLGRHLVPTTYLLRHVDHDSAVPQLDDARQMLYLLVKRIVKRRVTADNLREFANIPPQDRQRVLDAWCSLFGGKLRDNIDTLLDCADVDTATAIVSGMHTRLLRRHWMRHPFRWLRFVITDTTRKLTRLLHPTGFFIVILGPDGSGKSTVTEHLKSRLQRGFRRLHHFHWRPGLLPKLSSSSKPGDENTETVPDNTPAQRSHYGLLLSLVRFAWYWLDFLLGYWLVLYRRKASTTLIIGERYFADILVHPARYGFALPRWLMRFAGWFIPSPDLVVQLQDEPDNIYARKPELTPDVIAEQMAAYELEAPHWGETIVIRTDVPAEQVAMRIADAIIERCARRTRKYQGMS